MSSRKSGKRLGRVTDMNKDMSRDEIIEEFIDKVTPLDLIGLAIEKTNKCFFTCGPSPAKCAIIDHLNKAYTIGSKLGECNGKRNEERK